MYTVANQPQKPDGGRASTQTAEARHRAPINVLSMILQAAYNVVVDSAPGPHGIRRRNRPDRLEPGFPAVAYGGGCLTAPAWAPTPLPGSAQAWATRDRADAAMGNAQFWRWSSHCAARCCLCCRRSGR